MGAEDALPPLRLDREESESSGAADHPGDGRRGMQWIAVVVALVIGAVAGVVGVNARNEAVERNHIEVVAAGIDPLSVDGTGGTVRAQIRVSLLNLGSRPVDLVGISLPDWVVDADETAAGHTLEPDVWSTVSLAAVADCEPSAELRAAEAVVAVDGAERTIALDFPSHPSGNDRWNWVCQSFAPSEMLAVYHADADAIDSDATILTSRFTIRTHSSEDVYVTGVRAHARGFEAKLVDGPTEAPGEGLAQVEIEWSVADCAEAEQLDGAHLELLVSESPEGDDSPQAQDVWVENTVLVKLAQLSVRACP